MATGAVQHGEVRMRFSTSLRIHPSFFPTNAAATFSSSSAGPIFRVFCKGMVVAAAEVEGVGGDGDDDPAGTPVVAVAVCGPQGEVVLRGRKRVLRCFVGGQDDDDELLLLEAMALVEGLHTAIRMGAASVNIFTDHRLLHNYVLGVSRPTGEKLEDLINQIRSVRKQLKQCEISLAKQGQVGRVVKLPEEALDVEIARYLATKPKTESCDICLSDVDTTNFYVVEGCSHRFCLPCMQKHMEAVLLGGLALRCPHLSCMTKLTVEDGSKMLLPSRLLEMLARRVKEDQIHPSQRIYCPYPKCSALMSLSELQAEASCLEYMACNNAETTLRMCVECGRPLCVSCRVAWHESMSCIEYQGHYPHGGPEGEMLQKLARRRRWKQCERCNHMIELAVGCEYITCRCGNLLCYKCGETLSEDGRCGCFMLESRRRGGCFSLPACWGGMCRQFD